MNFLKKCIIYCTKKIKRLFQPRYVYVANNYKEEERDYFAVLPLPEPGTAWYMPKMNPFDRKSIAVLYPYKHKPKDKHIIVLLSEKRNYLALAFTKYPIEMWEILCEHQFQKTKGQIKTNWLQY